MTSPATPPIDSANRPSLTLDLLDVHLELIAESAVRDRVRSELTGLFLNAGATTSTGARTELTVPAGQPMQLTLAELTTAVVEHTPRLCVHAGVVSSGAGVLAIPGFSGLGKTTLTAALLQAGFGYLSDEALAVDRSTGAIAPFPRPLALAADVWPVLDLPASLRPDSDDEALVPVELLGELGIGDLLTDIVLATRRPGPLELVRSPRGPAVTALLRHSFNHFRDPAASFRQVVGLVRSARVWSAGYQDAPELAARLATELGLTGVATSSVDDRA